jgi:hypothetical protein
LCARVKTGLTFPPVAAEAAAATALRAGEVGRARG